MEDVVFASERPVGKRKRQDDDDDAERKHMQVKDESENEGDSFIESESDSDSDDEPSSRVENAMSTVRISTEPLATLSIDCLIAHIKAREHSISELVMQITCSSLHRFTFEKHMRDADIDELEIALRERKTGGSCQSEYPRRKGLQLEREIEALLKRPQAGKDLSHYISKLESRCRTGLKGTNPVRQALEGLKKKKEKWTIPKLFARINSVRAANNTLHVPRAVEGIPRYSLRSKATTNNTSHSPGVQGESSRPGGVDQGAAANTHVMQQEIQALRYELEQEKKSRREAARLAQTAQHDKYTHLEQASKIQEELTTTIKGKDKQLGIFKKAEQNLTMVVARRDAEIAALKSNRSNTNSQEALRKSKKAESKAQEAMKAAQAKTGAMYTHYDSVQNKNSILIGKLTMMAQVGGFGNHGSIYRKEFDALRARPLTELDEHEGQE